MLEVNKVPHERRDKVGPICKGNSLRGLEHEYDEHYGHNVCSTPNTPGCREENYEGKYEKSEYIGLVPREK